MKRRGNQPLHLSDVKDKKVRPTCPLCHSSAVLAGAYLQWNILKQQWEVMEQTDEYFCVNCMKECEPSWTLADIKRKLPPLAGVQNDKMVTPLARERQQEIVSGIHAETEDEISGIARYLRYLLTGDYK